MRSALASVMLLTLAACEARRAAEPVTAPSQSADIGHPVVPTPPSAPPSASPRPPADPDRFVALGTEPFWSVDVLPGALRYSDPENQSGTTFSAARTSDGRETVYAGSMDGKQVTLRLGPGKCSDGMSDTVYPYRADLVLGDTALRGCARIR